jgi:hypothetical protein
MRTERTRIMTNTRARPVRAEIVDQSSTPRGFGGYAASEQQRYRDIFGDDAPNSADFGYRGASGLGSAGDPYWRPFSSSFAQGPYEDTILYIQHNKRGVRFSLQATTRTFIAIVLIVIALINSPGIGTLISTLIKSILNLH